MEDIYFTVTGCGYRYGSEFLKEVEEVNLIKEPDNKYDKEAIQVKLPGLGTIGFVANSPHTVAEECYSAGRLYDKIGDTAKGKVLHVINDNCVVCKLILL